MSPFEYSLVLVTIVVGLAITDMLQSLHRLLRSRTRIRWHWLTLVAALLVLITLLQFWWGFYRLGRIEVWSQYGAFLLLLLQLILMFLLACAALPDDERERLDLAEYYEHNRRYFWTLFSLVAFMATVTNLVVASPRELPSALLLKAVPNLLYVGVMLSLAFVRAKAFHYGGVLLLLVVMVLGWVPLRIQ
jgi:Ca2+/Na+ antiporter